MKRILTPPSRKLLIVYRIIVALLLMLILLLLGGSLYAIFRSPGSGPLFRLGRPAAAGMAPASGGNTGGRAVSVFTGIGRLRIPVRSASGGATMLLSIAFPYPPGDRAFTEELASRIGNFRTIAVDYFSSLPPEKLGSLDEEAAKTEILRRYNGLLRLSKIETLYFSDLMIVE